MRPPGLPALRRALLLLLGGWLLVLIAETTPHLVHHLFDTDHDPECEYLAVADHAPAAVTAVLTVAVAVPACGRADPGAPPRPALSPARAPASRDPPTTPLALV